MYKAPRIQSEVSGSKFKHVVSNREQPREPKRTDAIQNHMANPNEAQSDVKIPVMREELHIGKRTVDTGRGVRLHKTVTEEAIRIDEQLAQQEVEIERVPINAWVDGPVPVQRHEADTFVIPVLEEVLVVEKRLRLKEEIRITARAISRQVTEQVVLRSEQVSPERFDEGRGTGTGRDPTTQ
jgi:uncharacterized protein (TIGR02271 family)